MSFIARFIVAAIEAQKDKFPIIAITGPRQSGKTTLLKTLFADYRYVSLEDPDIRAYAIDDPVGFLRQYNDYVIFDEVQQAPLLFSYIQTIVDNSSKMSQFILSGSQNFQLLHNITQSLAGRVVIFKLLPFDFREMKTAGFLPDQYGEACIKGFYPAIFDRNINPAVFYANYIKTYVERDISELVNIRDIRQFRAFIGLCAARVGQLLNLSALANECGITQPTAKAWLSILESSYIVFLVQPFYRNFNKRIVKSPKLYFYDTGLLCHILGIRDVNVFEGNSLRGSIFENLIIAELFKQNEHRYLHQDYWFWRDSNGHEVDLLAQDGDKFSIFEIKASQTILTEHFKGMDYFANLAHNTVRKKTLIYGGSDDQVRSNYTVLPWRGL